MDAPVGIPPESRQIWKLPNYFRIAALHDKSLSRERAKTLSDALKILDRRKMLKPPFTWPPFAA
jgi:hypothetical protein